MTPMFAAASGASLLAHQGGWDEVLMIGAPVLVIAGLLVLAKRRVDAIGADDDRPRSNSG